MAMEIALRLEKCLLPPEDWGRELSTVQKVHHYTANFFLFAVYFAILPFASLYSLARWVIEPVEELKRFQIDSGEALPQHFGFADSLFQTSGLGTKASATPLKGLSNFDECFPLDRKLFIDVLGRADEFIANLKSMGVTAHRFSLEWSVIEPRRGVHDPVAIGLYKQFIQKLIQNGITPYVTLHHFVEPEWLGEFKSEVFQEHALKMMEIFSEVRHWIPFNEINVNGLQKMIRGVYPPRVEGDFARAGQLIREMLRAHCAIYRQAKAKWPHLRIGSTHQWLKFEAAEGGLFEKITCYFLSKIIHYACYNFFKTGKFSFEVPFMANVQFATAEKCHDFIGVQYYGYPKLKVGLNWGKDYPGNVKSWGPFAFGATCREGGSVMSFGPAFDPESLDNCLEEASQIGTDIMITETGCDARVQKWGDREFTIDDEVQRRYFERIWPILGKWKEQIKGFFAWTFVRGHLEWDLGDFPRLGVQGSPAGDFLREKFRQRCFST
jgi:beta-glucosidase